MFPWNINCDGFARKPKKAITEENEPQQPLAKNRNACHRTIRVRHDSKSRWMTSHRLSELDPSMWPVL